VFVRNDVALRVAQRTDAQRVLVGRRVHPTIVDVDVLIAHIRHAAGDHDLRRFAHQLVGDAVIVGVPVVPAHRRGEGERLTRDDAKQSRGLTAGVFRAQRDAVGAGHGSGSGDDAGAWIESQRRGQPIGAELHRPLALAGDAVKKRVAGTGTVDRGAVETRRWAGLGC